MPIKVKRKGRPSKKTTHDVFAKNYEEYQKGRYSSRKQAVAVSLSQLGLSRKQKGKRGGKRKKPGRSG